MNLFFPYVVGGRGFFPSLRIDGVVAAWCLPHCAEGSVNKVGLIDEMFMSSEISCK